MKLKNSYILLIAMAIFLLISVGSVCASDIQSDDTLSIADSGADVVLANETVADNTPQKIDTEVVSEDVTVRDTEKQVIPVSVKTNDSVINITGKDLNITEGKNTIKFSYNNSQVTISDKLAKGNHSLLITYLGSDAFKNSSKNIILSVFGNYTLQTPDSVNINSTEKGEIPLNITDGLTNKEVTGEFSGKLSYKEGNNTTTVNLSGLKYENGILKFDYPLASNITSATIAVVYSEGEEKITKNITLNRIFNAKIEIINNVNEYQDGNFTFKLVDVDNNQPLENKKFSLTLLGNIRAGFSADTDKEGIATFKTANLYEFDNENNSFTMKQLEVGDHGVELKTEGNVKSTTVTSNLTIKKATIEITIDPFKEKYGTDKNVTITVKNKNSGNVVPGVILHLNMPETSGKDYYFQTDANGTSKISVKSLVGGTYNVNVKNNDTTNMNPATASGKITIEAIAIKYSVSVPSSQYYNTGNTATIKVIDKKTGKVVPDAIVLVQIKTGSKVQSYLYQANSKGVVTVNYAPAAVGSHKIIVSNADSRYSASSVTKSYKVKKASAKITASKVTAYYKGGKNFIIKLTNTKNKKAIYAAKLNVKIFISKNKYYNYDGQTGLDGKLRISLDSFKPGTYKVVVSKGESKNFTASQITSKFVVKKAPAKFTPVKLTAKKGENKNFNVTVKNTKTNKVIKNVNVKIKVYTGKTTKTYTVKTNSKGIALLNVKSLSAGTHKVVITSGNSYVTGKSATSQIVIKK